VCAAPLAVAACTLLAPVDDLSQDAGESDAALETSDEPAADVAAEASDDASGEASSDDARDAASTDDSSDASDAQDTSPSEAGPTYCAKVDATFCEDFDLNPLTAQWIISNPGDAGTIAIDDATASSPPNALLGAAPVLQDGDVLHARIDHAISVTASEAVVAFDLYVGQLSSNNVGVEALSIVFTLSSGKNSIQLITKSNIDQIGQQLSPLDASPTTTFFDLPQLLSPQTWTRVTIDIVFTSAPPTASVWFDQTKVLDLQALDPTFASGPVTVFMGEVFAKGPTTSASELRFDNVVVQLTP
jgi:hypothetical protein